MGRKDMGMEYGRVKVERGRGISMRDITRMIRKRVLEDIFVIVGDMKGLYMRVLYPINTYL